MKHPQDTVSFIYKKIRKRKNYIKGVWHELSSIFFHETVSLGPLSILWTQFQIFTKTVPDSLWGAGGEPLKDTNAAAQKKVFDFTYNISNLCVQLDFRDGRPFLKVGFLGFFLLFMYNLSYIYLGYFVCLCVIVCVCVCHNCGTLCYSFSFGNQTDQGDETEGLEREGLKMERYREGQIGEGGCEETFHCLSQTWETCRFTVPPAVALSNYISCGIRWRIFCQTGIFARFSQ